MTVWFGRTRDTLFSEDIAKAAAASSAVTWTSVELNIADPGLILYALDSIAAQIHVDPAEFRNQLIEQVQTGILDNLRPEQGPLSISQPIVAFLGGAQKLSLVATSAVAGGMNVSSFLSSGADWAGALRYMNLSAKSEPIIGN